MVSQYPRGVQAALGTLREHMAGYGYVPADVPIIQPADLFLTRAGDQILHKLFTFERHGIALALRPEFTTPALRRYIAEGLNESKAVARWQVAGIIFEDDPEVGNTSFERPSSGAECLGLTGPGAEAEIIAMAASGCACLQHPVASIVLGDARFLRSVLTSQGLDGRTQRFVLSHVSALSDSEAGIDYIMERFDAQVSSLSSRETIKGNEVEREFRAILEINERGRAMGGRTHADIARRLVQRQRRAAQREPLRDVLKFLARLAPVRGRPAEVLSMMAKLPGNEIWQDAFANWKEVIRLLEAYGFPEERFLLAPILARDWEYYSGITFELFSQEGMHLAGGGRYDEFARLIGSPIDVPAVGFTYYLDALLNPPYVPLNAKIWVLSADVSELQAVAWAQLLRQYGIYVRVTPEVSIDSSTLLLDDEGSIAVSGATFTQARVSDLVELLNGLE